MTTRQDVYVARSSFAGEGFFAQDKRVVLGSHWAIAKFPDSWRLVGTVDAIGAAYIDMLDDAAVLPLVFDRIAPPGSSSVEAARGGPPPGDGVTVAKINAKLVEWQQAWPPTQEAIADTLGTTDRRVRQVLKSAGKSWRDAVADAEEAR